jgi:hypothetical protein
MMRVNPDSEPGTSKISKNAREDLKHQDSRIEKLITQVCELEQLVIKSKTHKEEAILKLTSTHRDQATSKPVTVNIVKTSDPDETRSVPALASTPSQNQAPKGKNPDLTRYQ